MIPVFEEFMLPFLQCLADGKERNKKEMDEAIASYFNLTEEDKKIRTKKGSQTQLYDRVQWSSTYLKQANLVESPRRGIYKITQNGKDLLSTGITLITRKFLSDNYESFRDFATRKGSQLASPQKSNDGTSITESSISPNEQIEEIYSEINESLISDMLEIIRNQTPQFFEKLVVDLLVKMGYGGSFEDSAMVTQLVGDEGIDGIIKEDKLGLDNIYIQAKKWTTNKVSRPEIQKFVGAITGQNAKKGVFITTSEFTDEALKFKPGSDIKIVLIDGKMLAKYMIQYNLGVSVKYTYEIKDIDRDYFEI